MPQVAMTTGAHHLGSDHAETAIDSFNYSLRIDFIAETWPSASGIKFGFGFE
jgi:hypothetical protein